MTFLKGKHVLITAGPTREYIDPVRFISNDSTGLMSFALASEAVRLKAKVTLIAGPVDLKTPAKVKRIDVVSAREMFAQVKKYYKKADIIIMAAAVADWRPEQYSFRKLKKATPHPNPLPPFDFAQGRQGEREMKQRNIELISNPDILKWLGKHKRKDQHLVGFALETEDLIKNARSKLKDKNCDIVVANLANAIGQNISSVVIVAGNGFIKKLPPQKKSLVAKAIYESLSLPALT